MLKLIRRRLKIKGHLRFLFLWSPILHKKIPPIANPPYIDTIPA